MRLSRTPIELDIRDFHPYFIIFYCIENIF
nr:MAG TPA: hypothetical protein [Caudoviricetes sp.]